ncbi:hypothetical protein E2C01_041955 [Portunus trituberculatus]|uniref:Uncharacterized protein n=1 Tax=Portunus trituberculatus TaxID=210409 RepID=A0A5B7FS37_PORTR|nr:hypothetical protein [Portunus trituberculatus]
MLYCCVTPTWLMDTLPLLLPSWTYWMNYLKSRLVLGIGKRMGKRSNIFLQIWMSWQI